MRFPELHLAAVSSAHTHAHTRRREGGRDRGNAREIQYFSGKYYIFRENDCFFRGNAREMTVFFGAGHSLENQVHK